MLLSIYDRSFLPVGHEAALGGLTIDELARLRLSSLDIPVLPEAYERLVRRMTSQANQGLLVLKPRVTQEWVAGEYKRTEIVNDGPLEGRGKTRVIIVCGDGPMTKGLPRNTKDIIEKVVTPEAALALFTVDPADWSDGARKWCDAKETLSLQETLDRLNIAMSADEFSSLQTGACKLRALIDELERQGHKRAIVEKILDRRVSLHLAWLDLIRVPGQNAYYMTLAVHLFDLKLRPKPKTFTGSTIHLIKTS